MAKPKWKILNEIKEIAGYLCMKAETRDTVHNRVIHAWFTNGIPVQSGPEGFDGLPGMILGLEFNGGDVTVEAISVNLEADTYSLPLPKKIKGKEITRSDFDKKVKKHIRQSIGGERNPYWQMRY